MAMTANRPDVPFSFDDVGHWFSSPHAEQMMYSLVKAKLDRLCAHLHQKRLFAVRVCPLERFGDQV